MALLPLYVSTPGSSPHLPCGLPCSAALSEWKLTHCWCLERTSHARVFSTNAIPGWAHCQPSADLGQLGRLSASGGRWREPSANRKHSANSADAANWERKTGSHGFSNWQLGKKKKKKAIRPNVHWGRAFWWESWKWINLMRRGCGFGYIAYQNAGHRQIKPPNIDLIDIKEGDKTSRKPPVIPIYI